MSRSSTNRSRPAAARAAVAVTASALLLVTVATAPGRAQPAPPTASPPQLGTAAVATLVDVVGANFAVLNQALADPRLARKLLRGAGPQVGATTQPGNQQGSVALRVIQLGQGMDAAQQAIIRDTYGTSNLLQRNARVVQTILGHNRGLGDALGRNDVRLEDVVALDVVSQPPSLFVLRSLDARASGPPATPAPQAQPSAAASAGPFGDVPKLVPLIVARAPSGSVLALVPIFIQGEGPFPFALDTGASRSAIDLDVVQRLGLAIADTSLDVTGVGGTTQVSTARVEGWRVGEVELPTIEVGAIDLPDQQGGPPVQGLLGSDILSRFEVVTVDYRRGVLVLHEPIASSRTPAATPTATPRRAP